MLPLWGTWKQESIQTSADFYGSSDMLLGLLHKETLTPTKLNKEGSPDDTEVLPHISLHSQGKDTCAELKWHDQGFPIPHSSPATGLGH